MENKQQFRFKPNYINNTLNINKQNNPIKRQNDHMRLKKKKQGTITSCLSKACLKYKDADKSK